MDYSKKLVIRVIVALLLVLIPINVFYLLLLKPTLFLTFISMNFYEPIINSSSLIINNEILVFIPACIATSAYYLLAGLVLFTKDLSLKRSLKMFFLGSLMIFIFNLIRIDFLIYVLIEYGIDWFNKVHLIFWNFLSTVFVAGTWILLAIKFKVKTIPVYSDLKYLLKKSGRL
nr:pacearchaeosortase [Candidatus Woesearchaeota archaeon]